MSNQVSFIDFSKLKLNEAPTTPVEVEKAGSEQAKLSGQQQVAGTADRRGKQRISMASKTSTPSQSSQVDQNVVEEYLDAVAAEKMRIKMYESQKYDWRKALQEEQKEEKMVEDPNEPDHPYVKVMPNIHYKQIEAQKEIEAAKKAAGKAKSLKKESLSEDKKKKSQGKEEKAKREREKAIATRAKALKRITAKSDKYGKEAMKHHKKAYAAKDRGNLEKARGPQADANEAASKARQAKAAAVSYDPVASFKYARRDKPQLMNRNTVKTLNLREEERISLSVLWVKACSTVNYSQTMPLGRSNYV